MRAVRAGRDGGDGVLAYERMDDADPESSEALHAAERRLVIRLRSGDARALHELMALHYNPALRFAYAIVRSAPASEELVQDVFSLIWERREQLDPGRSVKSYLFTAVRNRALNHLKHRAAVQRLEMRAARAIDADERGAPSPEDEFFDGVTRAAHAAAAAALTHAIAQLPERRRTALALRFDQRLTFRALGEIMGLTEKAAQQLVIRTVAELRKQLRP